MDGSVRGVVSSTETSFTNIATLMAYGITAGVHDPSQFHILVMIGLAGVSSKTPLCSALRDDAFTSRPAPESRDLAQQAQYARSCGAVALALRSGLKSRNRAQDSQNKIASTQMHGQNTVLTNLLFVCARVMNSTCLRQRHGLASLSSANLT